jgi:Helix-turn-helix
MRLARYAESVAAEGWQQESRVPELQGGLRAQASGVTHERSPMIDPLELLKKELETQTQTELAKRIGISPQYLSDMLRRHRRVYGKALDYLGIEEVVTYRRKRS